MIGAKSVSSWQCASPQNTTLGLAVGGFVAARNVTPGDRWRRASAATARNAVVRIEFAEVNSEWTATVRRSDVSEDENDVSEEDFQFAKRDPDGLRTQCAELKADAV